MLNNFVSQYRIQITQSIRNEWIRCVKYPESIQINSCSYSVSPHSYSAIKSYEIHFCFQIITIIMLWQLWSYFYSVSLDHFALFLFLFLTIPIKRSIVVIFQNYSWFGWYWNLWPIAVSLFSLGIDLVRSNTQARTRQKRKLFNISWLQIWSPYINGEERWKCRALYWIIWHKQVRIYVIDFTILFSLLVGMFLFLHHPESIH